MKSVILLVLALLGAPLFAVIGASALYGFYTEEIDLSVVAIEFYRIAEMPVLIAIPLFTFAGYILGESKAPHRLVMLTNTLLGWMPGDCGTGNLCPFHRVHRRLRCDHYRARCITVPGIITGRLWRTLQSRFAHQLRQSWPAVCPCLAVDIIWCRGTTIGAGTVS